MSFPLGPDVDTFALNEEAIPVTTKIETKFAFSLISNNIEHDLFPSERGYSTIVLFKKKKTHRCQFFFHKA